MGASACGAVWSRGPRCPVVSLQPVPERAGGGDPLRGERHRRGDDPRLEIPLTSAVCVYAGDHVPGNQRTGGGIRMKAYVLINASPGRALEVAKKMEGVSGITAADAITGEYDVIAVCEAPDVNSIGSLIVDKIQKIEGVFKTVTCLAVK